MWLTEAGQKFYKSSAKPKYGVIRSYDVENLEFEWQPYRKGWKWDKEYIKIKWVYVKDFTHSIDTVADVNDIIRAIKERLKMPTKTFKTRPKRLPELSAAFIVRSVLENYAKVKLLGEEPDAKDASKGRSMGGAAYSLKLLKILIPYYDQPLKKANGSDAQKTALFRLTMGSQVREAIIDVLDRSLKSINLEKEYAKGSIDPRLISYYGLQLVPDITWELKHSDLDIRGQQERVGKILLSMAALTPKYSEGAVVGQREEALRGLAERYLVILAKKSSRCQDFVKAEFARPTNFSRKSAAARVLAAAGSTDVGIIREATSSLLVLVAAQPELKDRKEHFARQMLAKIMTLHGEASKMVSAKIGELEGRVADGKATPSDKTLVSVLKAIRKYAQGQQQTSGSNP